MTPRRDILVLLTDAFGGHGGIAAYNRDMLRALCESPDVRRVVAIPRLAPAPVGDLPANLEFDLSAVGGAVPYLRALTRQLRHGGFDLVYCAHVNLSPLGWIASKLLRVPWLLALYGVEAWRESPRRLTAFCARRADHLVAISRLTLDRFLAFANYDRDRTSLMPNAIHLGQFGLAPRNVELERRLDVDGRKVILTLGRMDSSERYKGFDAVLECLPSLARRVPNLTYLLAGDGDDRPRL